MVEFRHLLSIAPLLLEPSNGLNLTTLALSAFNDERTLTTAPVLWQSSSSNGGNGGNGGNGPSGSASAAGESKDKTAAEAAKSMSLGSSAAAAAAAESVAAASALTDTHSIHLAPSTNKRRRSAFNRLPRSRLRCLLDLT
jgi:hypothetical protein